MGTGGQNRIIVKGKYKVVGSIFYSGIKSRIIGSTFTDIVIFMHK